MTKKQLRKLLVYEGIYYAIISGFFGIVISYIFSKTLLSKILSSSSFWFFTINITLVPALIAFILMLGISMVVPLFSIKALNRHSIIERLKETTW
jgi:putative ABC transport system permease protein